MQLSKINNLTIEAYKKTARKYHDNFKNEMNQKEYDRFILDKYSELLNKEGLICDVGCGPSGHIGKYLYDKGHKVIGIDISSSCIEIAKNHQPNLEFKVMDMMNTEFEQEKFDGIISFYSIIHTPKKEISKIIKEFYRILKKDGKLIIVVKKGINEGLINDEWYEGNEIYFTNFLEEELITYLNQNSFEIKFIETRKPYENEFDVDRIYLIGSKK
jgi:2-polyprenyl-3-methyl-5-hydroxy-6-metoxy-1,4-benzoquinol methylase